MSQYNGMSETEKKSNTRLVKWQPSAGYYKNWQVTCYNDMHFVVQAMWTNWTLLIMDYVTQYRQRLLDKGIKD